MKFLKQKLIGAAGSVSGVASVLGSWQICHNVCLGIVALLSIAGIAAVGMPLEFLTKFAVPLWTAAFVLLLATLYFYFRKKCISKKLVLFNSGLIVAGIPFQPLQQFNVVFWVIGGGIAIVGVYLLVKEKYRGKLKWTKQI